MLVAGRLVQMTEEAPASGERQSHGSQLAEELLPLFDGGTLLVRGNGGKELLQSGYAMWRELDSHLNRVNDPTEDEFSCAPVGVALQ